MRIHLNAAEDYRHAIEDQPEVSTAYVPKPHLQQRLDALKPRPMDQAIADAFAASTDGKKPQEKHVKASVLVKPEPAKADADGWIAWGGGECPVDPRTPIDARGRSGRTYVGTRASALDWTRLGGCDHITHYRIVKGAEA